MNKNIRKNEFLGYFANLLKQNPNLKLSIEHIYSKLIELGVDNNKDNNIENLFKTWITYFENSENIDVFVLKKHKDFCNFVNKNNVAQNYNNHLKIYIPLDKEHIEHGAKLIFEFLNINNISHASKISKNIRFDDIVIRLVNANDLKLLLMFIDKMDYIKKGLIEPNPFAFNYNGFAMVCDQKLSYNYVISNYILLYLNSKKEHNQLDFFTCDEFIYYIKKYYKNNFVTDNKEIIFSDFINQFDDGYDEEIIENLKDITTLIINSSQNDFSLDDYINHYNLTLNKQQKKLKIDETMKYIVEIMLEKYNNLEIVKEKIINYIETGNERWITRRKDLRINISKINFRKELKIYLTKINLKSKAYIEYILYKYFSAEIEDYSFMKKNK